MTRLLPFARATSQRVEVPRLVSVRGRAATALCFEDLTTNHSLRSDREQPLFGGDLSSHVAFRLGFIA